VVFLRYNHRTPPPPPPNSTKAVPAQFFGSRSGLTSHTSLLMIPKLWSYFDSKAFTKNKPGWRILGVLAQTEKPRYFFQKQVISRGYTHRGGPDHEVNQPITPAINYEGRYSKACAVSLVVNLSFWLQIRINKSYKRKIFLNLS
jgi:hypothetical protein